MADPARRAWSALGRALWRIRHGRTELRNRLAPRRAERLYRRADRAAYRPFRSERSEAPPALEAGEQRIDVITDIAGYTQLPREDVLREVENRERVSFRAEWWATPPDLRRDHWFYLSSKSYLFANAAHFPGTEFADRFVHPHVEQGGKVLDFGGGTGNLALALATGGIEAWVTELNALQRDFIRFRVARHGLSDRVRVLDFWEQPPRQSFDAAVAVDVLEHLEDARGVLDGTLFPALRPGGVLVEQSPFVVNPANPMHHEDFGFEGHMRGSGFEVVDQAEGAEGTTRVWRAA